MKAVSENEEKHGHTVLILEKIQIKGLKLKKAAIRSREKLIKRLQMPYIKSTIRAIM